MEFLLDLLGFNLSFWTKVEKLLSDLPKKKSGWTLVLLDYVGLLWNARGMLLIHSTGRPTPSHRTRSALRTQKSAPHLGGEGNAACNPCNQPKQCTKGLS